MSKIVPYGLLAAVYSVAPNSSREMSVAESGFVDKSPEAMLDGFKEKPVVTGSYRLSPEAEADLYRIWLYGLEQWGVVEAAPRTNQGVAVRALTTFGAGCCIACHKS